MFDAFFVGFRDTRQTPDILAILVREFLQLVRDFLELVDVPERQFQVHRKPLDPRVDCHVRLPFQYKAGIDISKI